MKCQIINIMSGTEVKIRKSAWSKLLTLSALIACLSADVLHAQDEPVTENSKSQRNGGCSGARKRVSTAMPWPGPWPSACTEKNGTPHAEYRLDSGVLWNGTPRKNELTLGIRWDFGHQ